MPGSRLSPLRSRPWPPAAAREFHHISCCGEPGGRCKTKPKLKKGGRTLLGAPAVAAPGASGLDELKATLRDTYPTRPEASAQTLIHGGRVVRDEKKLDDVISKVRPQPSPDVNLVPSPDVISQ